MITFDPAMVTIGDGIHIGNDVTVPSWLLPELIPEANQITTNPFLDMSFGSGGAYQVWFNPTNGYGIQGGTIHASMDDIEIGWEAYDAATNTQYGVVTAISGKTGFADNANRYITLSATGFSTGLNWYFKSPGTAGGLTIATNDGGGLGGWNSNALSVAPNPAIGTTYTVGSTITWQDNTTATIIQIDDYSPLYIDIFWDIPKTGILFPITLST